MLVLHRKILTLWQPRYNVSRSSRSSFVTATNGVSVCVCACYVGVPYWTQQGTIPIHTFDFRKHPRSIAAVQQQPQRSYTFVGVGTPVPSFQLATPPGFTVNRISKENLVVRTRYDIHSTTNYAACKIEYQSLNRSSQLTYIPSHHRVNEHPN